MLLFFIVESANRVTMKFHAYFSLEFNNQMLQRGDENIVFREKRAEESTICHQNYHHEAIRGTRELQSITMSERGEFHMNELTCHCDSTLFA
jgi:hypothetical protein